MNLLGMRRRSEASVVIRKRYFFVVDTTAFAVNVDRSGGNCSAALLPNPGKKCQEIFPDIPRLSDSASYKSEALAWQMRFNGSSSSVRSCQKQEIYVSEPLRLIEDQPNRIVCAPTPPRPALRIF
jgi:hypothetical protein